MRFVPRSAPDAQMALLLQRLKERARKASTEVGRAKSKVERKKALKKNEQVYKDYKPYLEWLFNHRCSFCECSILRNPGDVEHYRPKSEVDDDKSHPGYYWLAFDIDNLLLSCEDCNRRY